MSRDQGMAAEGAASANGLGMMACLKLMPGALRNQGWIGMSLFAMGDVVDADFYQVMSSENETMEAFRGSWLRLIMGTGWFAIDVRCLVLSVCLKGLIAKHVGYCATQFH